MAEKDANNEIIVSKETTSLSTFSASGLMKRGLEIALLTARQSQIGAAENFLLRYITKTGAQREEKIFRRAYDSLLRTKRHNDVFTRLMLATLNEGTNFYQKINAKAS